MNEQNNNLNLQENESLLFTFTRHLPIWAITSLLVCGALFPNLYFFASKRESENLHQIASAIKIIQLRNGSFPDSLDEIYARSSELGIYFQTRDAFNLPYEYTKISDFHWYITGSKDSQLLTSPNWQFSFLPVPEIKGGPIGSWPQGSLMSELSPDQKFIARIFTASSEPYRRLVVVKNNAARSPVWTEKFNNVESFKWLSTGLVYTTSLSEKGRSGAHIYIPEDGVSYFMREVTDDSITSPDLGIGIEKARPAYSYNIAIIDSNKNRIEFAIAKDTGIPLSPTEFFKQRRAFSISYINQTVKVEPTSLFFTQVDQANIPSSLDPLTNSFYQLPTAGPGQAALEAWQEAVNNFENTPLFTDGLWILASLFRNAALDHTLQGKASTSKSLEAFAAEYSLALSRRKDAPTWMKNCSVWYWKEHQSGRPPLKTEGLTLDWK